VATILQKLPQLCWDHCGIVRDRAGLTVGLAQLHHWQTWLETGDWGADRASLEARNQLLVANLVLGSALWREESRGAHFRADYPETLDAWQVHTLVRGEQWSAQSLTTPEPGGSVTLEVKL